MTNDEHLVNALADLKPGGVHPFAACPLATPDICRFNSRPALLADNRLDPDERCAVFCCTVCGHGVTRPTVDDVSVFYQGRESQDYQRADSIIARTIKRLVFNLQARALIRQIGTKPRSVIDFACGSGLFTMSISENLPESSVVAMDFFNAPPCNMGRVRYLSFDRQADLTSTADLVICFHALEHDDDPHRFLDRLLTLLTPGGKLICEVPNVDCIWASVFGSWWDNWYLPFHRTHFSRKSLRALMEEHGLAILLEKNVCVPTLGRSFALMTRQPNNLFFLLLGAALHPFQWLLEVMTARPTALRIVAQKG